MNGWPDSGQSCGPVEVPPRRGRIFSSEIQVGIRQATKTSFTRARPRHHTVIVAYPPLPFALDEMGARTPASTRPASMRPDRRRPASGAFTRPSRRFLVIQAEVAKTMPKRIGSSSRKRDLAMPHPESKRLDPAAPRPEPCPPDGELPRKPIGFVGLGLMGSRMAQRLLDQGLQVVLYNRTRSKTDAFQRRATIADSPLNLARLTSLIGLMVVDEKAVHALLDGPQGLAAALGPGQVILNFSTVGVGAARAIGDRVRATGADYLDAPVLGSIGPAAEGTLLLFAGGEERVLERCRPLLQALARRIFYTGAIGQGSALKLISNMLLARYAEALAEVLALSKGFGVDPDQVLDMLQTSALASPMWEKGKVLLAGEAPLHFPMRHMAKDLRLLDEEIERLGLNLPTHESVLEAFNEGVQTGLGDLDYSEIRRIFRGGGSAHP
jgi:3-hydroxyisobutyrate dehydrogenase